MTLKAGDACRVLRAPDMFNLHPRARALIGRTVVLVRMSDYGAGSSWAPYWTCANAADVEISWRLLEKFPDPPPLEDDIPTLDEVVA